MTNTTVAEPRELAELSDEELEVLKWRLEQLLVLGFTSTQASLLAMRRDVDLGRVRAMIAQGCPLELAVQILR